MYFFLHLENETDSGRLLQNLSILYAAHPTFNLFNAGQLVTTDRPVS